MYSVNGLYDKKLLSGNYYPEVTAYYFKEWKGFEMDDHTHDSIEIMYVIKGKCKVGVYKKTYTMKKGEFILINSGVPHRLVVDENESCRMLNVEFIYSEMKIVYPSMNELYKSSKSIKLLLELNKEYLLLKDTDEIYPVLKSLILELGHTGEDGVLIKQLLFTQIFIRIAQLYKEIEVNSSQGSIYIKKALNYINYHYDYTISVDDVASSINIHPGYLHRIFKQYTGQTVLEYLTNIRIEKAKMLLKKTEIPVTEISGYVGINSLQYFTYLFKKHVGLTPLQYRKNCRVCGL